MNNQKKEILFREYCFKKKIDEGFVNNCRKKYNEKLNVLEVESIIADELFKIFKNKEEYYHKSVVLDYYKNFKWNKEDVEESIRIRNQAAEEFQKWAKNLINLSTFDEHLDYAEKMFNHVLEWGFGTKDFFNNKKYTNSKNKYLKEDDLTKFCKFIQGWTQEITECSRNNLRKSHLDILDITGIGIARSSKWICFIDQKRYAIYDSRVSLALSRIMYEDKNKKFKPFFQVLKRRDLKNKKYPKGETRSKNRTVEDYFIFLKFINKIAKEYGMKPFEVEMSLFMMGDKEKYYKHLF